MVQPDGQDEPECFGPGHNLVNVTEETLIGPRQVALGIRLTVGCGRRHPEHLISLQAGASDFVVKPVARDVLVGKVRHFLNIAAEDADHAGA